MSEKSEKTSAAEQQAITPESGAVYAELPDFDSGDEPIWEAVFNWKAATPGSDAHKKAMAVESAIINSLRDFADRTHALRMEQAAPKAATGEPDPADIIAGALQISRGHAIEMMREALEAAPQQEAQEPVWDGKLSDAMQNALDALYLECGPGITRDITHQVQKECEAIYTSYTTTKRMYQAARDRLELLEAAQPQPDPFAAPQPAPDCHHRPPCDECAAPAAQGGKA